MNTSNAPTSGTGTAADVKAPATHSPFPVKDAVTEKTPAVQTPAKGNDEAEAKGSPTQQS